MLTRILHNSEPLQTFLDKLGLALSLPQRQHILNLADFLRISPWSAHEGRNCLRRYEVQRLTTRAQTAHAPRVITLNLDDSLGQKDKRRDALNQLTGIMTIVKVPRPRRATRKPSVTWSAQCRSAIRLLL